MAAVTLVLGRYLAAGRQPRQRREDVRELCLDLIVERRERRRRQAGEVVVQRVHEDRERQVPLQLSRRPGKGERPDASERAASPRQLDRPRRPRLSPARTSSMEPSSSARPTRCSASTALPPQPVKAF